MGIKDNFNVTGDAKDSSFALLEQQNKRSFRCSSCGLVCAWIDSDGKCGRPRCKNGD